MNPLASAGNTGLILLWEDSTCCGAAKPMHYNFWAGSLELKQPQSLNPRAREPARNKRSLHSTVREEPQLATTREKFLAQQEKPSAAKNK